MQNPNPEKVVLRAEPAFWAARPFSVTMLLLSSVFVTPRLIWGLDLIPGWASFLLGISAGPIPLLWLWINANSRELVITSTRARKRSGVLSNMTTELEHRDVRNIQVEQGPIQRLTGCGTLRLSSAGQSGIELVMCDIKSPGSVRDVIYGQRSSG